MKLCLLGPQRFDPSLADAAAALGVAGKFALVTAGWQEREREDEELAEHLGGKAVNLELHKRADDVFARDPEFHEAYRARQLRYRQLQDFYRIRLEFLIESARVIAQRSAEKELLEEERQSSINAIRLLDRHHQRLCASVRSEFNARYEPRLRPVIAEHRSEVAAIVSECAAIAIAGGHVSSLLNRLHLFKIADALGARPAFAWTAGAMAITEQVVLFHDDPPHGIDAPQLLDRGLALVRGVVALPGPEGRLKLEDRERMAMYARRFAPRRCVVLPRRAWLLFDSDRPFMQSGALELLADGEVRPFAVSPLAEVSA